MERTLVFLFLGVFSVGCFPSRPLNDRPSELTWQAWLLVDSQNQLQNESDRRITPKSVFIAPKLGQKNVTLPDCADGYRADSMGRCIKFVKVDETAHLNFLLSRLNEMYAANSDEDFSEESEENTPTAGPLQVNIPFSETEEDSEESSDNSDHKSTLDVLGTNGQFQDRLNVKRQPNNQTQPAKVEEDYEDYEETTETGETTTLQEETTTETIETTTEYVTTMTTIEETPGITEAPTTTEEPKNDELKALFFRMPTKPKFPQGEATSTHPTPSKPKIPEPEETGTHRAIVEPPQVPAQEPVPLLFKGFTFPQKEEVPRLPTIKFQESIEESAQVPTIKFEPEYPAHVKPHYGPSHRPTNLTPEQVQEMFKQYLQRHVSYPERPQIPERVYNHRNRDRTDPQDLWRLAPPREASRVSGDQEVAPLTYGNYHNFPQTYQNDDSGQYFPESGQEFGNAYGRKRRRNFR